MRHLVLIRSAYGPGWDIEANRRRLSLTRGVTMRSLASQTSRDFGLLVLLHRDDPLLEERKRAFEGAGFLYVDMDGPAPDVAYRAYRAGWAEAIGPRNEQVAMTRLDDDDAFAPWAMERIEIAARKARNRAVLMLPLGVRVSAGRYTLVRHNSNAMQTLVTPPGDSATVYDYGHRFVRRFAPVHVIDSRPAWLWSRHPDTISGWRFADRPLTPEIRALFDVDWTLFGERQAQPRSQGGYVFR